MTEFSRNILSVDLRGGLGFGISVRFASFSKNSFIFYALKNV